MAAAVTPQHKTIFLYDNIYKVIFEGQIKNINLTKLFKFYFSKHKILDRSYNITQLFEELASPSSRKAALCLSPPISGWKAAEAPQSSYNITGNMHFFDKKDSKFPAATVYFAVGYPSVNIILISLYASMINLPTCNKIVPKTSLR